MIRLKSLFFIFIFAFTCIAQSNYELESVRETALLSSGISSGTLAIYLLSKIEPITKEEINNLSRNDVNSFDRFATYNWSPTASDISDVLLVTQSLSPLVLLSSKQIRNDYKTFLIMNAELYLLYYGTTHITKSLTGRIRPYLYNEKVTLKEKMESESKLSFFSGHAALSFASAVFLSTIYSRYYPDSKWKTAVWGSTLLMASATASLRVISGMHFLSDVLIGAAVGSLIGYLVPLIHEINEVKSKENIYSNSSNILSFTITF
jgi:membrane-associated phospholipid phosphatase